MKRITEAWRRHPVLTTGFVLAAVFTLIFAVRAVVFTVYWANPEHRDRAIEGWMTPRYVARSWSLPDRVVVDAMQLPSMSGRRETLADIAARQNISIETLEKNIAEAAARYRANPG